jgi:hypothetical protein
MGFTPNDGKIYVSANAGKSWQLHTTFGSEFSIFGLRENLWGQVHAELGFDDHSFELTLAQHGTMWRTM